MAECLFDRPILNRKGTFGTSEPVNTDIFHLPSNVASPEKNGSTSKKSMLGPLGQTGA